MLSLKTKIIQNFVVTSIACSGNLKLNGKIDLFALFNELKKEKDLMVFFDNETTPFRLVFVFQGCKIFLFSSGKFVVMGLKSVHGKKAVEEFLENLFLSFIQKKLVKEELS